MESATASDSSQALKASRMRRLASQVVEIGSIVFWTVFVVFVVLNQLEWVVSPPAALALLLLIWTVLLWVKYGMAPAETRRLKWFYLACGLITSVMAVLFVVTVLIRQVR